MADPAVRTPMQYLDKATGALRDMGLMPAKVEPAPKDFRGAAAAVFGKR